MNDNGKPNGVGAAAPPGVQEVDGLTMTVFVVNTDRGSIALVANIGPGKIQIGPDANLPMILANKTAFATPVGAAHVELEVAAKMIADKDKKPTIFRALAMPRGMM